MAYMNEVKLIGRLGRDPQGFDKGARLALAVTETRKDKDGNKQERTDWFRVVAWNKQGDFAMKYLKKGAEIIVSGTLRTGKYKDKDGVERYTVDVFATDIQVIKWPADRQEKEPAPVIVHEAEAPQKMVDPDEIPF